MRTRWLATLLTLGLIAAGCGDDGGGTDEPPDTEGQAGEGIRVAFVYDGTIDDGGWNTSHDAGRQYLEQELPGVETVTIEEIAPGDQARATFEDFATQGYDLVVGTTFYQDDVLAVGEDFPETKFLAWGGWLTGENVGQYSLATEDGRYLDGLIAGSVTEANTIGYPAGFPIEEVVRGINAFTRGVREVNPDATVVPLYTNSWYDPPKERQASESLVDAGADILVHELNSPAVASVAEKRGVWHMGYGWDQSARAPESWLGSFTFDWGPYYVSQVQTLIDGTWTGEVYYGGLADGVVGLAPFGPDVPQNVIDLVEQRRQAIASGQFDVLAGPIVDNTGKVVVAEGETIPVADRAACCTWLIEGVEGSLEG